MPAYDEKAEASVLGSVLLDNEVVVQASKYLKAEDFYIERNRYVWEAVLDLYNKQEPIDLVTLTDALRVSGSLEAVTPIYVVGLAEDVPTAAYADSYVRIVREKSRLRKIEQFGLELASGAVKHEDADRLLESFTTRTFDLMQIRERQDDEDDRVLDMTLKYADGSAFVPTGFTPLDMKIGGLPRGDLTYLGARNSHGKSALLYAMADNIVEFFRQEQALMGLEQDAWIYVMSPDQHPAQIWALETSRRSGIPMSVLQGRDTKGNLTATEEEVKRWQEFAMEIRATYPKRVRIRRGSITPSQVRTEALAALRGGAKMIAIDTIQRATSGSDNKLGEVAGVSAFLKDIAADYDVPVLALTQIRREVDDRDMEKGDGRRPHPNDIADAPTVIGNDAATMLLMYNDSRYNPYPGQQIIPVEVNVAKNKSGEAGGWENNTVALSFNRTFAHFMNPSNPQRIERWQG